MSKQGKTNYVTQQQFNTLRVKGGGSGHIHTNKEVLDSITAQDILTWDGAAENSHTHDNKEVLDTITQDTLTELGRVSALSHSHSNKLALDLIRYNPDTKTIVIGDSNNPINFAAYGEVTAYGPGEGEGAATHLYMLKDVPDYRTLYRGKYLRVKSDGSGTEWVDVQGGVTAFDNLTGRPSYAGQTMTSATAIPAVPTKVSDLTNDSGFITSSALNGYATQTWVKGSIPALVTAGGRVYGSGDDEGIIISKASNGYAGLILGSPSGVRSVFYLSSGNPFWRYNNGTTSYDISHPAKSGTIALTSDIPTSLYQLSADATHRLVTDTQISAWNNKWDYNENTIKAVKVNNAGNADTLENHSASYFQPASTAINTGNIGSQSVAYASNAGTVGGLYASSFAQWKIYSSPDVMYDFGWGKIGSGSGSPTGTHYGQFLTMPYRKATGNATPDFAWQIFGPNGDDPNNPDDIFVRTSIATTWRTWHKLYHSGNCNNTSTAWTCSNLTANGNIKATGEVAAYSSSDSRFKDDQSDLIDPATVLKALRPMEFNWNSLYHTLGGGRKGHDVGFIAQQVQPLIPSAIGEIYGGYLSLDYTRITPYLVAGWQSNEKRIEQLEREVFELKNKLSRLRNS